LAYEKQRRSRRLLPDVPLVVSGETAGKKAFREDTFTLVVNAHGALVVLAAKVAMGQRVLVMNAKTLEQREGAVAYFSSPYAGLTNVGIEFAQPSPEFWPVGSPPDDWKLIPQWDEQRFTPS
jgi:hypothetical protein